MEMEQGLLDKTFRSGIKIDKPQKWYGEKCYTGHTKETG